MNQNIGDSGAFVVQTSVLSKGKFMGGNIG